MNSVTQTDIDVFYRQVEACAAHLARRLPAPIDMIIQLGTGLGELASALKQAQLFPYAELPHFPTTTVASHSGNLVAGKLAGKNVAILQGRFHCYEGHSARMVGFPIRVLARLGAKLLLITNASGGLNPAFCPGELMIVSDHLYFLPDNPLRGPNIDQWGPRFPDCSQVYDPGLRQVLKKCAAELGLGKIREGVYVCVPGPSLETPAETRFLRLAGADAVGMSSAPEALSAVHEGLKVAAVSVLSNINDPEHFQAISLQDIVASAQKAEPLLRKLVLRFIEALDEKHCASR